MSLLFKLFPYYCTDFLPRFPAELFGVLYGTMLVVSAVVGCLQYALFIWSEHSQDAILQVSDRLSAIPSISLSLRVTIRLLCHAFPGQISVDVSCSYK